MLHLKDIVGSDETAAAAGLGSGIPNRNLAPERKPTQISGTPFSNFKKIV